MRIPLEASAKGMKNTDESGSEIFGFVLLMKRAKNNTSNSGKEAVKKRTVLKKKVTEFFGNGKNTVAVGTVYKLKTHSGSSVNGIHVTA
jgi:hypothetical protein